jgi:hypothetical protein
VLGLAGQDEHWTQLSLPVGPSAMILAWLNLTPSHSSNSHAPRQGSAKVNPAVLGWQGKPIKTTDFGFDPALLHELFTTTLERLGQSQATGSSPGAS